MRSPRSTDVLRVRAPASSANIGSGFDCAAVALDLWNELEVIAGDEPPDLEHLGVRAFARVPGATVSTAAARAALPDSVAHADAVFSAGRATLLGAALASGSTELFAAALDDRLHEPYRAVGAPLLGEIKQSLPAGALGATLSGSGPTVIVWAADDGADARAAQLAERFPDERILRLESTTVGASTYSP